MFLQEPKDFQGSFRQFMFAWDAILAGATVAMKCGGLEQKL